jgi:hypothetical protein
VPFPGIRELAIGPVDRVAQPPSARSGCGPGVEGPRGRLPSRLPGAGLAFAIPFPLPLLSLLVDLLGDSDELLGEACEAGAFGVLRFGPRRLALRVLLIVCHWLLPCFEQYGGGVDPQ